MHHLNDETKKILTQGLTYKNEKVKGKKARLIWINQNHFIYYPKATACLNELDMIYQQSILKEDRFPDDMGGMSIIGSTGSGKTSIIKQFYQLHSPQHFPEREYYPVGTCMLKDTITGLKGLYSALLSGLGHPLGSSELLKRSQITIDQLEDKLLYILKGTGVKMIFVDEFQHVKGKNMQPILNQLKRTMQISQVPFIPVGTPEIERILGMDDQLADRCPVTDSSELVYWRNDKQFRAFLTGYEKFLPFPEPSYLADNDIACRIFENVQFKARYNTLPKEKIGKTNLRNIARYLKKVSIRALQKDLPSLNKSIMAGVSEKKSQKGRVSQ